MKRFLGGYPIPKAIARMLLPLLLAIIVTGDAAVMAPPPAEVFLTVDSLSTLPLADYQAFAPPAPPDSAQLRAIIHPP